MSQAFLVLLVTAFKRMHFVTQSQSDYTDFKEAVSLIQRFPDLKKSLFILHELNKKKKENLF